MRTLLAAAFVGATAAICAPASAASIASVGAAVATPSVTENVQFRRGYYGRGYYGRGYYGRGYYGRGYGYRRGGVAAGVVGGLAAGAIIGGALASQPRTVVVPGDAIEACAARYRTYNPATQTYVVRPGVYARCP